MPIKMQGHGDAAYVPGMHPMHGSWDMRDMGPGGMGPGGIGIGPGGIGPGGIGPGGMARFDDPGPWPSAGPGPWPADQAMNRTGDPMSGGYGGPQAGMGVHTEVMGPGGINELQDTLRRLREKEEMLLRSKQSESRNQEVTCVACLAHTSAGMSIAVGVQTQLRQQLVQMATALGKMKEHETALQKEGRVCAAVGTPLSIDAHESNL